MPGAWIGQMIRLVVSSFKQNEDKIIIGLIDDIENRIRIMPLTAGGRTIVNQGITMR